MSDDTLTFYHAAPSRGSIVLWMLEEVEAPYRVELLDLNETTERPFRRGRAPLVLAVLFTPRGVLGVFENIGKYFSERKKS